MSLIKNNFTVLLFLPLLLAAWQPQSSDSSPASGPLKINLTLKTKATSSAATAEEAPLLKKETQSLPTESFYLQKLFTKSVAVDSTNAFLIKSFYNVFKRAKAIPTLVLAPGQSQSQPQSQSFDEQFEQYSLDEKMNLEKIVTHQLGFNLGFDLPAEAYRVGLVAETNLSAMSGFKNLSVKEQAFSEQRSLAQARLFTLIKESSDKATSALSKFWAQSLAEKNEGRKLLSNLKNKTSESAKTQEFIRMLKSVDHGLSAYKIPVQDIDKAFVIGSMAALLAKEATSGVDFSVVEAKIAELKDLKAKVDSICLLNKALNEFNKSNKENWKLFKLQLNQVVSEVKTGFENIKNDPSFSEQGRAEGSALLNDLISGQVRKPLDEKATGFLSEKRPEMKSLLSFGSTAYNLTNQAEIFAGAIEVASNQLGIRLSDDVKKGIKTVREINKFVSTGKAVAEGVMKGGYIGAATALLGSLSDGAQDPVAAQMAELGSQIESLRQDVKEIKQLQLETLDLQRKSLTAMKEISTQIQEYHQKQMKALETINFEVINTRKAILSISDNGILACEGFIRNAVGSEYGSLGTRASDIENIRRIFQSRLQNFSDIANFAASGDSDVFQICKNEILVDFSFYNANSSKFDYVVQNTEHSVGRKKLIEDYYAPNLNQWLGSDSTKEIESAFFPVRHFTELFRRPTTLVKSEKDRAYLGHEVGSLLSSETIERYVSNLLVLIPYLSIDQKSLQSPETFSNEIVAQNRTRLTKNLLQNALRLISRSIVQQSLLVGEPLIKSMSSLWSSVLSGDHKEILPLLKNEFLMKNLLVMKLRSHGSVAAYSEMMQLKNVVGIADALGVPQHNIRIVQGQPFLLAGPIDALDIAIFDEITKGLSIDENGFPKLSNLALYKDNQSIMTVMGQIQAATLVILPTAFEVEAGQIIHSPQMLALIQLQSLLLKDLNLLDANHPIVSNPALGARAF